MRTVTLEETNCFKMLDRYSRTRHPILLINEILNWAHLRNARTLLLSNWDLPELEEPNHIQMTLPSSNTKCRGPSRRRWCSAKTVEMILYAAIPDRRQI